ncbi:hypothetical protein VEx25_0323, partial [Vibrio antiquarius]
SNVVAMRCGVAYQCASRLHVDCVSIARRY